MKKYSSILYFVTFLTLAALACHASGAMPTTTPILADNTPTDPATDLKVVYVKDSNVWSWTESSGSVALTNSGDVLDVSISDDGQVVAYVREIVPLEQQEIWALDSNGSNPRLLVNEDDFRAANPNGLSEAIQSFGPFALDWLPGTHILYYNTQALMEYGTWLYDDLYAVNADNLEKTTIFSPGSGGMFYLSPDGSRIALVTPTSISLADSDGGNLRSGVLTFPESGTYSEYRYYPQPIWAMDSSALRVAIPPVDIFQEPVGPTSLWNIPADGSPATQIGSIESFIWPDNAFAPNLTHVAYVTSAGELYLKNTINPSDIMYTTGEAIRFVGWLPDSTQFLFSIRGTDAASGLYLGTDGRAPVLLSAGQVDIDKLALIDQTRFLYTTREVGSSFELWFGTIEKPATLLLDSYDNFINFDCSKY